MLKPGENGYRGGRIKSTSPTFEENEIENGNELRYWCEKFVTDPATVKSFALRRTILHHDSKKLEQLLRSLVSSLNYRGHVAVEFPVTGKTVRVYSPGRINSLRTITWLRWVFYLTFLWIFTWPYLFFITRRYEVVEAVFPYSTDPASGMRIAAVMSEVVFFEFWKSALKRGVLSRFQGCMDEEYRLSTMMEGEGRGDGVGGVPSTGNAFADGALGLLAGGLQLRRDVEESRGWGFDS